MYDTGRFFTVTGNIFDGYPKTIENRSAEINSLYSRLNGYKMQETAPLITVESKSCDIDVDSLPLNYGTKKLIKEGEVRGKRSEALMSVVNSLVSAGISEPDIFKVFENYPIGEKYREKGASKTQWLKSQIDKAKDFVTVKKDSEDDSETGGGGSNLDPYISQYCDCNVISIS